MLGGEPLKAATALDQSLESLDEARGLGTVRSVAICADGMTELPLPPDGPWFDVLLLLVPFHESVDAERRERNDRHPHRDARIPHCTQEYDQGGHNCDRALSSSIRSLLLMVGLDTPDRILDPGCLGRPTACITRLRRSPQEAHRVDSVVGWWLLMRIAQLEAAVFSISSFLWLLLSLGFPSPLA